MFLLNTVDSWLWITDSGLCILDSGLWIMDSGFFGNYCIRMVTVTSVQLGISPCILQENLCSTFWQHQSPAERSLGLFMSRPAKSPGRSCPIPSNRDEMNWEKKHFLYLSAPRLQAPHFGRLLCWMGVAIYSWNYSGSYETALAGQNTGKYRTRIYIHR